MCAKRPVAVDASELAVGDRRDLVPRSPAADVAVHNLDMSTRRPQISAGFLECGVRETGEDEISPPRAKVRAIAPSIPGPIPVMTATLPARWSV